MSEGFEYRSGQLFCDQLPVSDLAEQYGTPAYIYSYEALKARFCEFDQALSKINRLICFSVKANSNVSILRSLVELGAGLDIVSGGELQRALKAGCQPGKIVFAGVGKGKAEIRQALEAEIKMFNVESWQELERINQVAADMDVQARVSLRVNPDVDPKTHEYITTGKKENKFGFDFDMAFHIFVESQNLKHVKIIGIHSHIGSQITEGGPFVDALKRVKSFIENIRSQGYDIEVFNFGGGLGIVYKDETPQSAQQFGELIVPYLQDLNVQEIVFEPGRFIAGNAGVLVTEVQYIKESGDKNFVIVDAAMNDLLRPSLYNAYHKIDCLEIKDQKMTADIVGPICETGDFFAKQREISEVGEGDVLAIMSAGAYGFTMASNYNTRPKPPEILIKDGQSQVIRKRESVEDLLNHELAC